MTKEETNIPTSRLKKIFSHFTLAPLLGIFVFAWLVSGVVMLFVSFPKLRVAEKAMFSKPILASELKLIQPEFETRKSLTITKQLGSIYTDKSLAQIDSQDIDKRLKIFFAGYDVSFLGSVINDQWTVHGRFDKHRPLLAWKIHDEHQRIIYISSTNGQIVQDTTRHERIWNYFGAILHWIYLTPVRENRGTWVYVVNAFTLAALWMTGLGFVRGWKILRIRKRYRNKKISPFWNSLKYHHVLGVAFGFFLLTWLFSGFLSMSPFAFMDSPQISDQEKIALAVDKWTPEKNLRLQRLLESHEEEINDTKPWKVVYRLSLGKPLIELFSVHGRKTIAEEDFSASKSIEIIRGLHPGVESDVETIPEHDLNGSNHEFPNSGFRIQIKDSVETWYEVDGKTGLIVRKSHLYSRIDSRLFKALHTFDFGQHQKWDWLRKLAIILVSLFSAGLVGVGFYSYGKRIINKYGNGAKNDC